MTEPRPPEVLELPPGLFARAQGLACRFEPGYPEAFALPLPQALERAVAKRRCEFLAGRWCVQQLYTRLGLNLALPAYAEIKGPVWPSDDWPDGAWHGSITHSRDVAAAVIAPMTEVLALGLDAEPLMAPETASRVRASILRPEEHWLLAGEDWLEKLTLAFSFKESIYKAFHPIIQAFFGFEAVEIRSLQAGQIDFRPHGVLREVMTRETPHWGSWARLDDILITAYEWEAQL